MCECAGCSGCTSYKKGPCGVCGWALGRYFAKKQAVRCHWCFGPYQEQQLTSQPLTTGGGHTPHQEQQVTSLPLTTGGGRTPLHKRKHHHIWNRPFNIRLSYDSIGRLTSRNRYITDVQTQVASECNIGVHSNAPLAGGDLPEVAYQLENDTNPDSQSRDLDLVILMSNYAANTLGQPAIASDIAGACHRLHKIAESAPVYVVYGGPGEMWSMINGREGGRDCFESKTARIRDALASSANIKAISGANDFRAFFAESDLDYMGHIKGVARHKAIEWLVKVLKDVSDDHFKTLLACDLVQEDPPLNL